MRSQVGQFEVAVDTAVLAGRRDRAGADAATGDGRDRPALDQLSVPRQIAGDSAAQLDQFGWIRDVFAQYGADDAETVCRSSVDAEQTDV